MGAPIEEPAADVCILGLGVAGGIIAVELALAGYKVVGIEKGPYWDYTKDFSLLKYDEWGVYYHRKFDHPLRLFTYTLRNDADQMALPVRRNTVSQYVTPGHGVGGMAQHYGGMMGRFGPWVYQMKSSTESRYGSGFLDRIDPTNDIEDWPMTYDDYEPYYVAFEKAWGITGTNQGPLLPMSEQYPLPPHPYSAVGKAGFEACEALGYHPYPMPTALASVPYMNSYGVQVNACVYEGWCGETCNFVCQTGAKANSAYRTVPAAMATGNFSMALNSYVFRLDLDQGGTSIAAARYYDAAGGVHVQPAKVFYVGMWGFNVPRLLLLSGIGQPYNPSTVTGSLGRGPQYGIPPPQVASVTGTLAVGENLYPAGNASGGAVDILDLADDNFDHTGLDFIGGGMIRMGAYPGGGPKLYDRRDGIANYFGPGAMGSGFKASIKDFYLPTTTKVSISMDGPELPDTRWCIDLDPHYVDWYGDPLSRFTYNFGNNSYDAALYLSGSADSPAAKILGQMGCTDITVDKGVQPGDLPMDTYTAHIRGGCRMGADAATSVLNKYGQAWGYGNLFAGGEVTDTTGDNTTVGGTHPMGAVLYVHAEGIKKYLESPRPAGVIDGEKERGDALVASEPGWGRMRGGGPLGDVETRLPRAEDFAMLRKPILEGVVRTAVALRGLSESWALGGDAGEVILGVNMDVSELEVLTTEDGCREACRRLDQYLAEPPRLRTERLRRDAEIGGERYPIYIRSIYAKLDVGVKLELHGDEQIKVGEWDWGDPIEFSPVFSYVVGEKVPVVPLRLKSDIYLTLGWTDRVERISSAVMRSHHRH